MKKKVAAFVCAAAMVFGTAGYLPQNVVVELGVITASAETYGDFEYKVIDEDSIEITKYKGTDTEVDIPDTIDGMPVTSISRFAFRNCTKLTSIIIPSSVKSIGYNAFQDCTNLTNITIPDSVTNIGSGTFSGCTSLTSITMPNSVTRIEYNTFRNCKSLTHVTIPNSVISIGDSAFYQCESLTSITIPDSVMSIGEAAFSKTNLKSITIPNNITVIENGAFDGCTNLTSVMIPDSVTNIEGNAFSVCLSLTNITIPNNVTSIGGYAFSSCTSLTSITIPDSVTSIGRGAFHGCTSLTIVTIPQNVTSIGDYAFGYSYIKEKNLDFKIYCYKDSAGEKYAIDNGLIYELLPEPHEHELKEVSAKPATCEESGNTAYWYCPTCDMYFSDADGLKEVTKESTEIKASGHAWGEPTYTWSSDNKTCTAKRVCENDNSHIESETVNATSIVKTPATCTEKGTTTYTVTFKNTAFEQQTKDIQDIGATGHTSGTAVKENEKPATCTEAGSYDEVVYCTDCHAEINRTTKKTEALGHKWGEWTVTTPATEDAEGVETRTCEVCGETETKTIPKLEKQPDLYTYTETATEWSKDSGEATTLTIHRSSDDGKTFENFKSVEIDGEVVSPENYTAEAGSLILTFKPEYLATLSEGEHSVKVIFTDGEAEASLTISAPSAPEYILGDANGDGSITVTDISKVAAHVKGIKSLSEEEQKRADANSDGSITVTDISKIAAHVKGIKALS